MTPRKAISREAVELETRKPLSRKQRAELFLAHQGKCCLCGEKILNPLWVDEHISPLWVGGSNDLSNRGPAHVDCARDKTRVEATARAKVKRLIAREEGTRKPRKPIQSRGFDKTRTRKFSGEVVAR